MIGLKGVSIWIDKIELVKHSFFKSKNFFERSALERIDGAEGFLENDVNCKLFEIVER